MSNPLGSPAAAVAALRKHATREALLDAALLVFTDQGLAGPTDQVARLAGVGPGTLYRHFPTKQALQQALFSYIEQELALADELVWPALPPPAVPTLRERLAQYWEQAAHFVLHHPRSFRYWQLYQLEFAGESEVFMAQWLAPVQALLAECWYPHTAPAELHTVLFAGQWRTVCQYVREQAPDISIRDWAQSWQADDVRQGFEAWWLGFEAVMSRRSQQR